MIQTKTPPATFASDADFRSWGKNISDMLAAAGFVKTSDTGQIDWATVAKPAVVSTAAGYEIWRFDDPLQADFPIFFKIEYGTGASAATNTGLWITVGTSSDGAGAINSTNTTGRLVGTQNAAAGAVIQRMSADDGRLSFCTTGNTAHNGLAGFCIERLRDVAGDFTDDGVFVAIFTTNNVVNHRTLRNGVSPPSATETSATCLTPSASPGIAGTTVGVYPWHPVHGPLAFPILSMMSYFPSDIQASTEFEITRSGVACNYLATNVQSTAYTARAVSAALAMIWE